MLPVPSQSQSYEDRVQYNSSPQPLLDGVVHFFVVGSLVLTHVKCFRIGLSLDFSELINRKQEHSTVVYQSHQSEDYVLVVS